MDSDRVEYLKEKRLLLQNELRLKKIRDKIATELNYLQKHNFHCNLFYDFTYINWINENVNVRNKEGYHGSHGDFQIDVNDRDAIYKESGTADDFLKIKPIAEFFNKISNDTMLIICSLFGNPEFEISKNAFLSKPSIFLSTPENWVLTADKKYVIESMWDQGVIRFIDLTQEKPILKVRLLTTASTT